MSAADKCFFWYALRFGFRVPEPSFFSFFSFFPPSPRGPERFRGIIFFLGSSLSFIPFRFWPFHVLAPSDRLVFGGCCTVVVWCVAFPSSCSVFVFCLLVNSALPFISPYGIFLCALFSSSALVTLLFRSTTRFLCILLYVFYLNYVCFSSIRKRT